MPNEKKGLLYSYHGKSADEAWIVVSSGNKALKFIELWASKSLKFTSTVYHSWPCSLYCHSLEVFTRGRRGLISLRLGTMFTPQIKGSDISWPVNQDRPTFVRVINLLMKCLELNAWQIIYWLWYELAYYALDFTVEEFPDLNLMLEVFFCMFG